MYTVIYDKNDYYAFVTKDGTLVVHRLKTMYRGAQIVTHVGEKHRSQDWREVQLFGCPAHITEEIKIAYHDKLRDISGV